MLSAKGRQQPVGLGLNFVSSFQVCELLFALCGITKDDEDTDKSGYNELKNQASEFR